MGTCPTCATHYPEEFTVCPVDGAALSPDDPELVPGAMVGEYRVQKKLDQGGFGTVYQVVHPVIGKAAALKVLSREFSSDPEMVSRFVSEARAVNQIRHKGIVDIFAFGTLPSGRQYFVMELLQGLSLDRHLARVGAIKPEVGLPLLRSIARALDAAHAAGIVHRDLKPENVFLDFDEDGLAHTKLLDFGIAKHIGEPLSNGHKTEAGLPMGTPRYMSPEQCRGLPVERRTDVYSFGLMCFQVLTGTLPFDAPLAMDLLIQHTSAQPPLPSLVRGDLPGEFDEPLLHMLKKSPQERPASAGAAIEELFHAAEKAGLVIPGGVPKMTPPPVGGFESTGVVLPGAPELAKTSPSHSGLMTPGLRAAILPGGTPGRPTLPDRPSSRPPGEQGMPARARHRVLWILVGALGLGVLGGGAIGLFRQGAPEPGPSSPGPTPVPTNPGPALPTPVSTPAAGDTSADAQSFLVPENVTITVHCPVHGAAVFLGAQQLGLVGEPLKVPYGTRVIGLAVKAPGYQPVQLELVPRGDQTVNALLKPAPMKVHKDLESPF